MCCINRMPDDHEHHLIHLQIWSEILTETAIASLQCNLHDLHSDISNLRSLLESSIPTFQYTDSYRLSTHNQIQPWSIFDTNGTKIDSYASFMQFVSTADMDSKPNLLLIYEGGQFMYPGVAINFTRSVPINLEHTAEHNEESQCITYELKTLSLKPLVFAVDNFISVDEQQSLLQTTRHLLHGSQVENETYSHWRTSSTAWIKPQMKHRENDELSLRIARLVRLPYENQEDTQVLQYLEGQHYGLHLDFFSDAAYREHRHNRLLTVLWYFNEVHEGGWTIFPMYNATWIDKIYNLLSIQHCQEIGGLMVKPEKGRVVLFYNLEPNGDLNNYSLHGSCPVGPGEAKYAANKWIWNVAQS